MLGRPVGRAPSGAHENRFAIYRRVPVMGAAVLLMTNGLAAVGPEEHPCWHEEGSRDGRVCRALRGFRQSVLVRGGRARDARGVWNVVVIAIGGGIGTALRYGVSVGLTRWVGASFPWATLAVNVLGSFLLAGVMELAGSREIAGVPAKLVLGAGLLGGFTTYSSFNLETIRLAEQGAYGRAAVYVVATLAVCLLAALAGLAIARRLRGA